MTTAHFGGPIVQQKYIAEQHGGIARSGDEMEKALLKDVYELLATHAHLI